MANKPVQILADESEYRESILATDGPTAAGQIPLTGTGGTLPSTSLPTIAVSGGGTGATTAIGALDNLTNNGTTVVAAATIDLEAATGDYIEISGNTPISAITLGEDHERRVRFTGVPTIVTGASLSLPGGADIVVQAGDIATFRGMASDVVRCVQYQRAGTAPHEYFVCLVATHTLESVDTEQGLFDSVGTGTLTLPVGTYFFDALASISSMTADSGNAAFDLLGAGTATLGSVLYAAVGVDGAVATAAAAIVNMSNTAQSTAAVVTAATETALQVAIRGTFRVTVAGTIIPSVTLANAAAAVVAIGSYFRCTRVGSATATTGGPWS